MSAYNPQNKGRPGHPQRELKTPAKALEVRFFEDQDKKRINPTLLDKDAEKQADQLHEAVGSAQLRRFFGEVKNLSLRMKQGRTWSELEPFVRMVKSKAMYAKGRSNGTIPDEFRAFLTDNIDRIKDQKDFEAFALYFEAVVGYMYGKGLVKK